MSSRAWNRVGAAGHKKADKKGEQQGAAGHSRAEKRGAAWRSRERRGELQSPAECHRIGRRRRVQHGAAAYSRAGSRKVQQGKEIGGITAQ